MLEIEEPIACPSCNYTLVRVNDQLFCRNSACPAQILKKVEHFCKTLGIKGMGPKTIEKLQIGEITEVFYLPEDHLTDVLGEKVAAKLFQEIEGSKTATLDTVLAAFSIPLIGSTAAKKIASYATSIDEITQEVCKTAGLGTKATENLLEWLNTEYRDLKEFLPFEFKSSIKAYGPVVCITGKLKSVKNKSEAEALLKGAGFKVVESVTKTTNYLLDEEGAGSSKREKAEKYGITIITDLKDLLKVNNNE